MRDTKNGAARLNVNIEPEELHSLKQAALNAKITLKKYVRLRLGLDAPEKGKKLVLRPTVA